MTRVLVNSYQGYQGPEDPGATGPSDGPPPFGQRSAHTCQLLYLEPEAPPPADPEEC